MLKKELLIIILLAITKNSYSQMVMGVIFDENGAKLPGVNVFEKGYENNLVISDTTGRFEINAHSDTAHIFFKYVGYLDSEVLIDTISTDEIKLILVPDITELEEIFYFDRNPNTIGFGYYGTSPYTPFGLIIGQNHYIMKNYPKSIYSRFYVSTDFKDQYEGFIEFCPYQIYTGNREIRFDFMFNYLLQNKQDNDFADYIINADILNKYINVKIGYGLRYERQSYFSIVQCGLRKNFSGFMPSRFNIIDHLELAINSFSSKDTFNYNGHIWFEFLNSGFYIGIGYQKYSKISEMNYEVRYIWRYY